MNIVEQFFVSALYVVRYLAAGGVAVFIGGFIQRQWEERAIPRWSSWIAIFLFGVAIWHLHDLLQAVASQSDLAGN